MIFECNDRLLYLVGFLKLQLLRMGQHGILEFADDLLDVAIEDLLRALHILTILLDRDIADTRCLAPLDVVLEADSELTRSDTLRSEGELARAELEQHLNSLISVYGRLRSG